MQGEAKLVANAGTADTMCDQSGGGCVHHVLKMGEHGAQRFVGGSRSKYDVAKKNGVFNVHSVYFHCIGAMLLNAVSDKAQSMQELVEEFALGGSGGGVHCGDSKVFAERCKVFFKVAKELNEKVKTAKDGSRWVFKFVYI